MAENILVSVAWPYANADIHVGNITGAYLPADIFARYHRLAGNRVLMVSGSDSHGTPITVRADAEKTTAREVFERFHRRFLELYLKLGLSYDLFTHTDTENHHRVSQAMFTALLANGYLKLDREKMWYSASERRFLPDRYVEGECYICHYPNARGDQCDNCGNLLDANLLINPRSKNDGSTPELRETEHYYLDLPKLGPALRKYLAADKKEERWRPNVINFARNQVAEGGLLPRPITRDLDWGIPVPLAGWEGKCLYVWFEAVIGYFSASIEWAANQGQPEAWKDWWYDTSAKTFYFIGKDNIPFHAVIWPAELIGSGPIFADGATGPYPNLPYDVPANEFMNMEGRKISGSRNWGVWGLDFLSRYDPDPLRYYLTANMPEARDSDWSWDEFVARNNNELVATWGNLANRILTFAYKNFDGRVPDPGELRPEDNALLSIVDEGHFKLLGQTLSEVKLRATLGLTMAIAAKVNQYLDRQAPWFEVKSDRAAAAKTVYTTLKAVDSLKTLFAPFLPFTSERLHALLGYDGSLFGSQKVVTYQETGRSHDALTYDPAGATGRWSPSRLPAGQRLRQPEALFKKLEEKVAEEERARLGQATE